MRVGQRGYKKCVRPLSSLKDWCLKGVLPRRLPTAQALKTAISLTWCFVRVAERAVGVEWFCWRCIGLLLTVQPLPSHTTEKATDQLLTL